MKVSIITCVWNSEPFIADSIASVLAQDYPDIEYIIVDGGSTDGTLERVRSLPRPCTLLENVRGGISHAMNQGINASTGDVIAHLHGDDYYLHGRVVSRVVQTFRKSRRAWVVGRTVFHNEEGKLVPTGRYQDRFSKGKMARGVIAIPHAATFVSRRVLDDVGTFDEALRYAMDWDLWYRIASRYEPAILPEELAAFREHAGSTSAGSVTAKLNAARELLEVRRRYAGVMSLNYGIWLLRYLVRTRRLRGQLKPT